MGVSGEDTAETRRRRLWIEVDKDIYRPWSPGSGSAGPSHRLSRFGWSLGVGRLLVIAGWPLVVPPARLQDKRSVHVRQPAVAAVVIVADASLPTGAAA